MATAENPPKSGPASGGADDEEEEEFIVEKIIDMRVKGGKKEYYLKWKGYPE